MGRERWVVFEAGELAELAPEEVCTKSVAVLSLQGAAHELGKEHPRLPIMTLETLRRLSCRACWWYGVCDRGKLSKWSLGAMQARKGMAGRYNRACRVELNFAGRRREGTLRFFRCVSVVFRPLSACNASQFTTLVCCQWEKVALNARLHGE
jgi:hypothetical protein